MSRLWPPQQRVGSDDDVPPRATQIQSFHVDAWGGGGSVEWHSVRQWVLSTPPWLKRTCRICDAVHGCHVSAAATRAAAAWTGFISGDHRISKIQQHRVFPESAWILHKTCCQQLSEGQFFFFWFFFRTVPVKPIQWGLWIIQRKKKMFRKGDAAAEFCNVCVVSKTHEILSPLYRAEAENGISDASLINQKPSPCPHATGN